ncbi:MAG: dTMP kinase [Acholeplasmatales bacterium]|jgi:dTMP kinase|nr:dTMP kinase [Acholeplasmatales bacterium]
MFITFEGGEGSGKTTIINNLHQFLLSLGREVVLTREPGGTRISEEIRNIILNPENTDITSATESILYAASRAQHIELVIKPALDALKIVICDRFLDSSYAYQAYARKLGMAFVKKVNTYALPYVPSLTFYIDLTPQIGLGRIQNRSKRDRLDVEKIDFHNEVRKGYLKLAKKFKKRYVVIDGTKSIEEITSLVISKIKEKL